jgi:hypothetical protein
MSQHIVLQCHSVVSIFMFTLISSSRPSLCLSAYISIRSSVCICQHLYVRLSVHQSVCQYTHLPVYLSTSLSVCPPVCPSLHQSVCVSTSLFQWVCPSICLFFDPSVSLSFSLCTNSTNCLYVFPSIYQFIQLSICLLVSHSSVHLSVCPLVSLHPSVCWSVLPLFICQLNHPIAHPTVCEPICSSVYLSLSWSAHLSVSP